MARFVPSSFSDRSLIVPLVRVSWGGEVRPQNDHRTRNARWVDVASAPSYDFLSLVNLVVTGCSRGVGAAYVAELAACGLNIVLVSRENPKLQEFAEKIGTFYFSLHVHVRNTFVINSLGLFLLFGI